MCEPKPDCETIIKSWEAAGTVAGGLIGGIPGAGEAFVTGGLATPVAVAQTAGAAALGGIAGHALGELASLVMNYGETSATKAGRAAHDEYSTAKEAEGYVTNKQIPGTRLRPDALSEEKGIIRELKPNNAAAIRRGLQQLERYRKAAEAAFNRAFKTVLDTYESPK